MSALWRCRGFLLFIYDLFNDAVNSSGYLVSIGRMISERELEKMWEETSVA
jgi:hypothetical protein